jgi:hypothetical protein
MSRHIPTVYDGTMYERYFFDPNGPLNRLEKRIYLLMTYFCKNL